MDGDMIRPAEEEVTSEELSSSIRSANPPLFDHRLFIILADVHSFIIVTVFYYYSYPLSFTGLVIIIMTIVSTLHLIRVVGFILMVSFARTVTLLY